jgi:hypothetical protein
MRHINRNQHIRTLLLQSNKRQHNGRKIRALGVWCWWWSLCCNERVGWCAFSVSRD